MNLTLIRLYKNIRDCEWDWFGERRNVNWFGVMVILVSYSAVAYIQHNYING